MAGDEDGGAVVGQPTQEQPHLPHAAGIETVGGLVEDQQLRSAQQRQPDTESLAHPLAVGLHAFAGGGREADGLEHLVHPAEPRAHIRSRAARAGEVLQVLAPRQVLPERRLLDQRADPFQRGVIGANGLAQQVDLAAGRQDQPQRHPDRRGLAGAVRTEEPEQLTSFHGEVDRIDGGGVPVALREAARGDRRRHGRRSASAWSTSSGTEPTRSHWVPSSPRTTVADSNGPAYGSS